MERPRLEGGAVTALRYSVAIYVASKLPGVCGSTHVYTLTCDEP